jgi:hypothetical protein
VSDDVVHLGDEREARAHGGWHVTEAACLSCGHRAVVVSPGPMHLRADCPRCGWRTLAVEAEPLRPANDNERAVV